ncbi:response regulator transcription factor [Deinococcus detaillensis]|uniref:Response regulator transcription factor n=1 Tax=Deinococcus detaillensis TaxID=2592048 RepID=A0A553UGP2_9DEIO|nr:response regulator transcription factor [Deinococcus detaillensis]
MSSVSLPSAPIRIQIVEDHDLTRISLRALLSAQPGFQVVCEARTGEEALAQLAHSAVNVVLMDINLPGIDGIQAATEVGRIQPDARVMMLTASNRRDQVCAALASGAVAYCLKSASPEMIYQGVLSAATGGVFFDPQSAAHLLRSVDSGADLSPLSVRETSALRLVADGLSNKEIAQILGISVGLVKQLIQDILSKLQATDRTQAAVKAFRAGLI